MKFVGLLNIGERYILMANENLNTAKVAKNDEFFTQFQDIQQEINHYLEYDKDVFRDKTILLPCDDPEWSNFTKFFAQNFSSLGLKKLISTSYAIDSKNIQLDWQPTLFETESPIFNLDKTRVRGKIFSLTKDNNDDGKIDINDLEWEYMEGDGDFRSDEVKKLRDEADIIITNPPFSLFREFLAWIFERKKKFLIIGSMNAITYKEVFPLIKENEMWLGCGFTSGNAYFKVIRDDIRDYSSSFYDKNTGLVKFGNVRWFTNLDHGRRHEKLTLMSMSDNIKFNKKLKGRGYQKYDNYDAIEVPFVNAIPSDYFENMAVPISYFDKHNSQEFEIVDANTIRTNSSVPLKQHGLIKDKEAVITENNEKMRDNHLTSSMSDVQFFTEQNRTEDALLTSESLSEGRCSGIMGVPISFLDKYNPEQFEIVGLANSTRYLGIFPCLTIIDGRKIYNRLLIKHKIMM